MFQLCFLFLILCYLIKLKYSCQLRLFFIYLLHHSVQKAMFNPVTHCIYIVNIVLCMFFTTGQGIMAVLKNECQLFEYWLLRIAIEFMHTISFI